MNKQLFFSKKTISLGLFICGSIFSVIPDCTYADTPQPIIAAEKEVAPQNISLSELRKKTEEFLKDSKKFAEQVDDVLASLLTIPENKRQYYFPYLHEETFIPHKIKSHPQIIVWKGKRPTIIAPQMQEFAKKYLDDLPAAFYYFLDPDMYEQPQALENTINSDLININMPQMKTKSVIEIADYAVRDLRKSYVLPDEIRKNFDKPTTNETEVKQFMTTLPQLISFVDSFPENEYIPMKLRHLIGVKIPEALAKPFEIWVRNIRQTKAGTDFETFIQKQGWKNGDEFAKTADKILRAARVSRMTLVQAISYSNLRAQNPIIEGQPLTDLQLFLLMYEVHPGDALFLAKDAASLRKLIKDNNFVRIGLSINID